MTAATALSKTSIAIRGEIKTLVDDLATMRKQVESKVVRLSNLVAKVRDKQMFREWINPKTRKPFKSFEDWIKVEVKASKASVYRFIGVKEHLNLPDETLEMIGTSRAFELVKVAKEKPKMLPRIVKEIEKHPDMSVFTVQQMVTNVIEGHNFDSGQYERMDFALKVEDVPMVRKAFAVMQAIEPVKNPEAASGRGLHLVSLCQEYLSGREEREMLKRLEDAGAFKNGNIPFAIEDE
jgi:hypothetical protein